jgi:hypothetical protein
MTNKKVVVDITFQMLREVPENWTASDVEFWLNESSHCFANDLYDLVDEEKRAEDGCCFTCHRTVAKYIKDAEPHDIENLTPPKPKEAIQ